MSGLGAGLFAALCLLPAVTGPGPGNVRSGTLTVSLCNGGSLEIPAGPVRGAPAVQPCCAKGCRGKRRPLIEDKEAHRHRA